MSKLKSLIIAGALFVTGIFGESSLDAAYVYVSPYNYSYYDYGYNYYPYGYRYNYGYPYYYGYYPGYYPYYGFGWDGGHRHRGWGGHGRWHGGHGGWHRGGHHR